MQRGHSAPADAMGPPQLGQAASASSAAESPAWSRAAASRAKRRHSAPLAAVYRQVCKTPSMPTSSSDPTPACSPARNSKTSARGCRCHLPPAAACGGEAQTARSVSRASSLPNRNSAERSTSTQATIFSSSRGGAAAPFQGAGSDGDGRGLSNQVSEQSGATDELTDGSTELIEPKWSGGFLCDQETGNPWPESCMLTRLDYTTRVCRIGRKRPFCRHITSPCIGRAEFSGLSDSRREAVP